MKNLLLFALLTTLMTGCSLLNPSEVIRDPSDGTDDVLLRIENASRVDFSSVLVRFPGAEARYDAIAAGQISKYRRLETAYRYGYIEVEAESKSYRLQPIDYVGEQPLDAGRYTYELNIAEGNLTLEFERD